MVAHVFVRYSRHDIDNRKEEEASNYTVGKARRDGKLIQHGRLMRPLQSWALQNGKLSRR
jgi:hypothetical protein